MTERDYLVAFVAFVLGAMMLYSAILNEGWCFQMAMARKVSKHAGHQSARVFIGSVGTFVILLGVYTLFGHQINHLVSRYANSGEGTTQDVSQQFVVE